jgi:hypothetical protein
LAALHADTDRRPIAEPIVDQVLAEDESRYKVYEALRLSRQTVPGAASADEASIDADVHEAMVYFLKAAARLHDIVETLEGGPSGLITVQQSTVF